jgi:hypothetical protein
MKKFALLSVSATILALVNPAVAQYGLWPPGVQYGLWPPGVYRVPFGYMSPSYEDFGWRRGYLYRDWRRGYLYGDWGRGYIVDDMQARENYGTPTILNNSTGRVVTDPGECAIGFSEETCRRRGQKYKPPR